MYNYVLDVFWFSHSLPSPPPPRVLVFCFVYNFFKGLVQAVNDSNLQGLFYDTTYGMVSTIDYSKEPLDFSVVDSPRSCKSSTPLRPCRYSKGSLVCAIVARVPLLDLVATWRLISSYGWTFDQPIPKTPNPSNQSISMHNVGMRSKILPK